MKTTILTATIAAALIGAAPLQLAAQQPTTEPPLAPAGVPGFSKPPSGLPVPLSPKAERPAAKNPEPPSAQPTLSLKGSDKQLALVSKLAPSGQPGSASVPPLVIQFSPGEATAVSAMEEDLAIMTRLLEKSLDQTGEGQGVASVSKLGLKLLFSGDSRSVRATYLEGFGALFMLKVNFPVFGAPKRANSSAEDPTAPKPESEWERAKRELAGGGGSGAYGSTSTFATERDQQFDPNAVGNLTKAIIQTLGNSSNIRGVKPEEFIAVTIFGSGAGLNVSGSLSVTVPGAPNGFPVYTGMFSEAGGSSSARGTVLTLRVKRSDVDALSKNELTAEEFHARVTTHAYAGNGQNITSLNSWARDAAPDAPSRPSPALRR